MHRPFNSSGLPQSRHHLPETGCRPGSLPFGEKDELISGRLFSFQPPQITDFSQQNVNNSETMGFLKTVHIPGILDTALINQLLRIDLA